MAETTHLPDWIHQSLNERLEGVSRRDLAARAAAISEGYRARSGSEGIRSELDALAYTLVRMPATYAAVRRALLEAAARCAKFTPSSLLDLGAGPGTATWAARETWPSLERATLIDQNSHLLALARKIGDAGAANLQPEFVAGSLPGAFDKIKAADLVTASYALTELPTKNLPDVLKTIWEHATQALAIVEPGTPDGFKRLTLCRDWLIANGAHIVAPCTHMETCPLIGAERWCHFNVRLPRRRDHLLVKSAQVNYEDEKFCYLIAAKETFAQNGCRRILSTPRVSKQEVRLTLCAPGAVEERPIPRKEKDAYKTARHYDWGDAVKLP
jgi:ribosomal protein RSM22 (predicted rRNA methylase)